MTLRSIKHYGEFDIDDTTGLPVVPERQFWRVRVPTSRYVDVELREKTWWGSRKIGWHPVQKDELTRQTILEAAAYYLYDRAKKIPLDRSLLGDYPPKKI